MKPKIEFYNSDDNLIYTVSYHSHSELGESLDMIQVLIREVSMNLLDEVLYVLWYNADSLEGFLINAE